MSRIQEIALTAQLACIALANVPGVSRPVEGALLLGSFWFLGVNVGSWASSTRFGANRDRAKRAC